jgi:protein-tyrosine phosphatase
MAREKKGMQGYFDIHCHILPGVDDGPKTIEETLRMLYIAYEEGIRIITATPHYITNNQSMSSERIQEIFYQINQAIADSGLKLNIILGSELLFSMDTIEALNRGDALTIDGTRYILVEFPPAATFRDIWNGLNHCIFGGYIPILAHAERYQCLVKDAELVEELINLGAYIQLNLSCLSGKLLDPKVSFCHKLLKKDWVHFLGTDAHGAYDRVPRVKDAVEYLKKKFGESKVRQLLWENPMVMLENKHL